jgi:hypothetical protein
VDQSKQSCGVLGERFEIEVRNEEVCAVFDPVRVGIEACHREIGDESLAFCDLTLGFFEESSPFRWRLLPPGLDDCIAMHLHGTLDVCVSCAYIFHVCCQHRFSLCINELPCVAKPVIFGLFVREIKVVLTFGADARRIIDRLPWSNVEFFDIALRKNAVKQFLLFPKLLNNLHGQELVAN